MDTDRTRVEQFLYHEARLLDGSRYADWLDLWAQDALYWVPANDFDYDPSRHVSIIYADRQRIQDIVDRLMSGAAYAQDPVSRMSRIVANIEVEAADDGLVAVQSVFNLTELRRHRQRTLAGRTIHRLRPGGENGGFTIVYKKVNLISNDEVVDNLTFLL